MIHCRDVQALLPQYVADGQPAGDEYAIVQAHLHACQSCMAVVERLELVDAGLSRWPMQQPPPGLTERIMAAIDKEAPVEAWSLFPRSVWLPVLTLLVALVLAIHLTPSVEPNGAALYGQLSADPSLLLALWIGVSMAISGVGLTLALVHGRLPDEEEMDHLRHRLSDTAHRLRRLAGQ